MPDVTTTPALPLHPFARLLPEMPDDELDALVESIAAHGQQVPATSWVSPDGTEVVIDGRHRARACERLGIPLIVERLDGDGHAARAFVLAANVTRRHLSASQRAVAAAALATRTQGQTGSIAGSLTQQEAATAAGVSLRLVRSARTFSDDADLTRQVLDGELTVTEAERRSRNAEQFAAVRTSASDEWLTPLWVLERVVRVLGTVDGDVCAEPGRRVPASWHLTEEDDALKAQTWANPDGSASTVYMNPPWDGAAIFVRRLLREVDSGHVQQAVVLLPARLGSEYVARLTQRGWPRVELTGRLQFEPGRGATASARGEAHFASMLIGVGVEPAIMHTMFGDVGTIMTQYLPET